MPDVICEPYDFCEKLSSQTLISQCYHGRTIGRPLSKLNFGPLFVRSAYLMPYVRTWFNVQWVAKEACRGPVNEIVSLAPAETLSRRFYTFRQHDFTRLVQDAVETTNVTARTDYVSNNQDDRPSWVDFIPFYVNAWGSLLGVVGAGVGAVAGGPIGAVVGAFAGEAIDGLLDGGGGGGTGTASGTMDDIDAVVDTVETTQTRHLTETVDSTTTITERTIERSITNPYRDRSLQLRFMPMFRRFEVITTWYTFEWGVVLDIDRIDFPSTKNAIRIGDFMQSNLVDVRMSAVANAELGMEDELLDGAKSGAVSDHLNSNPELYSKQWLKYLDKRQDHQSLRIPVQDAIDQLAKGRSNMSKDATGLSKVLTWNKAYARNKSVYVPITDSVIALKTLKDSLPRKLDEKLKLVLPGVLRRHTKKRDVHMFLGTHVEPAAGDCILQDVPEPAPVTG